MIIKVSALPNYPTAWSHIDWSKCHKIVRSLQSRIVKAVKANRWGQVKALQWTIAHSFSAKALAIRRVTENTGKRTAGVDKVIWSKPKDKYEAIETLKRKHYKPSPLRRVYIPKKNGKNAL